MVHSPLIQTWMAIRLTHWLAAPTPSTVKSKQTLALERNWAAKQPSIHPLTDVNTDVSTDNSDDGNSAYSEEDNQPSLQLADVDFSDADENDDNSDLISLAATLGKEGSASEEPELGAVVEGFESESNPVETDTTESNELEPVVDAALNSEQSDEHHVESVEISAHDLDIDEWKAPESPRQRSNDGEAGPDRGEAEADLRRVIDDFAEEHRQQLDADSQLKSVSSATTESNVDSTSATSGMESTSENIDEPVTTEDDENGVQRTRLYGISGTVDSELNSDIQNEAGSHPSDEQHGEAKSGEP